jgi:hypothetical protein
VKVGPSRNYLVRVLRSEWVDEPLRPELYRDIYVVTLQTLVDVVFVPDASAVAPPWDPGMLPADGDDVATVDEARVATVLWNSYVVTPNADRAGTVDRVPPMRPTEYRDQVVIRYVGPAEFDRYLAELDRLTDVVGSVQQATIKVDDLRDYEVIRFIDREIAPAPWLRPGDAQMLGRDGAEPRREEPRREEPRREEPRREEPRREEPRRGEPAPRITPVTQRSPVVIPSYLLALALVFTGIIAAAALAVAGVPPLWVAPVTVYGLALAGFLLGRWLGDVGWVIGNTAVVFGAIVLGFTAGFAGVDLDAEDPRTLLGWLTFAAALLVPYGLYGAYRVIVERRAGRSPTAVPRHDRRP